ncbi:hypothetical protein ACFL0W_03795 [Nanoarchaeota archaeon]
MYELKNNRFVDRTKFLDNLAKNISAKKNSMVIGGYKSGKTWLVKKALENTKSKASVYIDLNTISISPESFAAEITAEAYSWKKKKKHIFEDLKDLGELESKLKEIISTIQNELEKIKPDQKLLVTSAIKFLDTLAKDCLVCIDNFEQIIDMNNFEKIKDIVALFEDNISNSGLMITSRNDLDIKNTEKVILSGFDEKESSGLMKNYGITADAKKLAELTSGNPFVMANVCARINQEKIDLEKAFALELLDINSPTYNHLNFVFNDLMSKARGKSLLKTIMKVLAEKDDLRLTEIARKIYRIPPVTKALLERLMLAGLVEKKENKFYYADQLLKLWAKNYFEGNIADAADNKEVKVIR